MRACTALQPRDVAHTLNNPAVVYEIQGKYSEAAGLYKRALAIREMAEPLEMGTLSIEKPRSTLQPGGLGPLGQTKTPTCSSFVLRSFGASIGATRLDFG